ncbi:MAG: tRNA dihydrouridine(20/20a) synthase DusA [Thiomonas sp.]
MPASPSPIGHLIADSMQKRISVAPMLDWTDRHCRFFHRLITRDTLLYSEMVTTGALLHGDVVRHLDYSEAEHPVALQLGGSEPRDLAHCARLAAARGYDEVNLNCGCPSPRVQRGAFGACLMAEPRLVRDAVAAMRDAVAGVIPVTVKHRIGIDHQDSYGFVRDFVGTVAEGGCTTFIVHARSAWLDGLSPKENRSVPPLRHAFVLQLKRDFPQLRFVLNGGIRSNAQVQQWLEQVDGVMVGRAAYEDPWMMAQWDGLMQPGQACELARREEVEEQMCAYIAHWKRAGLHPQAITRHMLNLWKGQPGARLWRQVLSDARLLSTLSVPDLFKAARDARLSAVVADDAAALQPSLNSACA